MDCCDPNGLNGVFRGGYVAADKRSFLRRGLDARQQLLLGDAPLPGLRHLDLGGGVGALAITALERGAAAAVLVEVSRDSLTAAREIAARRGVGDRLELRGGDALRGPLERADLVTLDRVVCCTPDGPELLARAASLSARTLAFSYPSPGLWTRLFRLLNNGAMRLIGKRFRFHLHAEDALRAAATSAGHEPVREARFGVWRVVRLERPAEPAKPAKPANAAAGDSARVS